jgi:hypothetical protein
LFALTQGTCTALHTGTLSQPNQTKPNRKPPKALPHQGSALLGASWPAVGAAVDAEAVAQFDAIKDAVSNDPGDDGLSDLDRV